ncbi:glycosyltransferase family 4 protein [Sphingobium sp. B2]|uniref:glycosyltransferase family 4 protein n=1 Tax=Sphingobium sp. B2 TaxID=2583228 RepID=UPI001643B493|nr:glycosyltransferase family 4 protein [Sphingobium sp. B2]
MTTTKPSHPGRILYVAVSQGHLAVFHNPYLSSLRARGHIVDVAAGATQEFALAEVNSFHDIRFARSPLRWANVRAFWQLVRLMRTNRYSLVHCHTPVASALTRLTTVFARGRPVVLYTAHGFHFFPSAPRRNWLLWFPLEWLLTRLSDFVITINHWDFEAARRLLRASRPRFIPGVGVDLTRFANLSIEDARAMRAHMGISERMLVILYIAEFIPRKNHAFLLTAFARIREQVPNACLLLLGDGPLQDAVRTQAAALGLTDAVHLLGFRRDVPALTNIADIAVSTSRQEGLGLGLAEAMACGLPVIASEDRGHRELVRDGETGFLYPQGDMDAFIERVVQLARDPVRRVAFGEAGRIHAQAFGLPAALAAMRAIYDEAEALAYERVPAAEQGR